MLNEISETVGSYRLPDKFLDNVYLPESTNIRVQSPIDAHISVPGQPVGALPGLASIINTIIDTSAEPYGYSVVLGADSRAISHLRGDELVIVEISIKVVAGKIGIMWTDNNYQPFASTERYASAMRGVQRILVSIPSKQAHHLVFRNVASDSTGTTFKITGVKAKVIGDSLYQRAVNEPVNADNEPDAEALYLRAQAMARAGDLNMAARLFADATALAPGYAEALEGQGEVLDMAGQSDLAMAKYDAMRKLWAEGRQRAPDRPLVLQRKGRSTADIAGYTAALHSAKHRPLPYIARGNAFLAQGDADRALVDYETALQLKPTAHEISALKGEALSMLGCYMEALESFDSAVAARPQDAEALSGRAIVHLALGKLRAADADWRRQLELLPWAQPSARACTALRLADYEAALLELERAIEKEPANPYWRLYRLTALRRLGQPTAPPEMVVTTQATANDWPNQLLALYAGQLAGEQVLAQADYDGRRAEALFQLGVFAFSQDREDARRLWTEVVEHSKPDLIEHAAARHELARLGS